MMDKQCDGKVTGRKSKYNENKREGKAHGRNAKENQFKGKEKQR